MKPSDYFMRQCFISVDVEEALVDDVIRRLGDGNVVISTDYPHADSHWPNAINHFMAIEMPASARKRSCGTTARDFTASINLPSRR